MLSLLTGPVRILIAISLTSLSHNAVTLSASEGFAIHLHLNAAGRIAVDSVAFPPPESIASQPGMLLWTEEGRDRWQVLPGELTTPTPTAPAEQSVPRDSGSRGESASGLPGLAMNTTSLDQLVGGEIFRAATSGALVTPVDEGMLLNGAITLRRQPTDASGSQPPYPSAELVLRADQRDSLHFTFPQGQATLAWRDIADLPAELADGLPPGEYLLSFADGDNPILFGVESKRHRDHLLRHADAYSNILGTTDDPVFVQLASEAMLTATDADGRPSPYLVDAYDLLTKLEPQRRTAYLSQIRTRIEQQLRGEPDKPKPVSEALPEATGIAVIDLARQRITSGRWLEAEELLKSEAAHATERAQALARLYQAVILAESGPATGEAAYAAFLDALEGMSNSPPADVFRAHNNFANFLLARAQDRAYDHAFQIATGVPTPLFIGLNDWHLARVHYQQAESLAESLDAQQAASVRTNIARQYALLADYLQLLNSVFAPEQQWQAGQQIATEEARQMAQQVSRGKEDQVDPPTRAGAYALLARIAHREGDGQACRDLAREALQWHLQDGSLAGVESIHRLIGVSLMRQAAENPDDHEAQTPTREAALQHLLISHALAESLRERFPRDTAGLSRAGFFARRAYVHEQILELLIAAQRPAEALSYAELAKSRSLQDFLATRATASHNTTGQPRALTELLRDWPADTVALEYFLGAEKGWVFVVDSRGQVQAYSLVDQAGAPLASRQIVQHVQQFVSGLRGTSRKMFQQHAAGLGFDKSWQDELHVFYQQLIPTPVRELLADAEQVLIIPHHILHYFPFAALVTKRDEERRISIEMPQPTFLIDGNFQLCFAPSLTAWDTLRRQTPEPIRDTNAVGITEFVNAPRLPGVEQDLANFENTFSEHPREILRGQQVDEASFAAFLKRPGLLFVATHGMNIADQPLDSFLLCHAGDGTDGRLTAGEILGQSIGAQVVVLSACYSGLADRSPLPGDDLFGLQRALLQSGATNVVCGLWDVYDQTGAQLMHVFFQRLKRGDPVHTALGNSQRAFLQARRKEGSFDPWIHPYFWAVYIASGSDLTTVATGGPAAY